MPGNEEVILESADIYDNGAIVTFGDGRSAFYSAKLLRSIFPQAEEIHSLTEDAESDASWKKR